MQISKYLLANERDALWGITVTTVGYEEIAPDDPYPTRGHADGYYFELNKGRTACNSLNKSSVSCRRKKPLVVSFSSTMFRS